MIIVVSVSIVVVVSIVVESVELGELDESGEWDEYGESGLKTETAYWPRRLVVTPTDQPTNKPTDRQGKYRAICLFEG